MKSLKMILTAAAVIAFGAFANAQTTIHITGSTAFRAAAHKSILAVLGTGTTYGYTGTTITSASQAIFTQTNFSGTGQTVIVKTSWSGSVGGLQVLTKNYTVPEPSVGVVGGWLVNTTPQSTAGTPNAPSTFDTPAVTADAAFSDSFQSSTIANSPVLTGANSPTYINGVVAVVPFEWVSGNGAPGTLTNVTNFALQSALAGGTTLAQFTGASADNNVVIEVMGRDSDSGTRLEAFAESQYGVLVAPTQYQPTIAGGSITDLEPWPAQVTDGVSYPSGHEGFSSGGSLATALNTPGSQTATNNSGVLIAYLGISDAATVTTGKTLNYNGVPYSVLAVENGQYSFWAYEHIYYRPTLAGTSKSVVDAMAVDIHNNTAATSVSGILLGGMQVGRAVEGGLITLGNPY